MSKTRFPKVKQQQHVQRKSEPQIMNDPEIGEFLKLDRDDPMLDDLMLSIQSKKHRETRQILVLEGRRLIQEALLSSLEMKLLLFSKIEQVHMIKKEMQGSKAKLLKVANHNLKFWSQLTTPPGILAIFERPLDMNALIEKRNIPKLPISLICDNIRDPSNLGAIIRVAAAASVDQIILTKGNS